MFAVLEDRLKDPESKGWLALGRMTLADLANFSWVAASKIIGDCLELHHDGAMHTCMLLMALTASSLFDIHGARRGLITTLCVSTDLDLTEFPAVKEWHDKLLARPAVRKGLDVPTKNKFV